MMAEPSNVPSKPVDWFAYTNAPVSHVADHGSLASTYVTERLWFEARASAMRLLGVGLDELEVVRA